MTVNVTAILSPGDMGHAVGRMLVKHGMKVITCLEGRSARTAGLAEQAGITPVDSYNDMVKRADLILSIMVPSEARKAAGLVADALRETKQKLVYADCNAIAPATVRDIGAVIDLAGSTFIDAGIIGGPPSEKSSTLFCVSGPSTSEFEVLREYGLTVRVVGDKIGQASGLKMVYAALTKGTTALTTELLVAAWRMGLYDRLMDLFRESQTERYNQMQSGLVHMPYRSRRWVGEMEEIAKTFADLDLTPRILEGAADLYRFVGETPLADETPETLDRSRTLEQLIRTLSGEK